MHPPISICLGTHTHRHLCAQCCNADAGCTDGHTTTPRARTRAHTFTQTWIRYMHSYLYICAHTYTYICKSCGRARPRRSRRALTRTYAHAHTRRHVLYICSLTYTYRLRHTICVCVPIPCKRVRVCARVCARGGSGDTTRGCDLTSSYESLCTYICGYV